MRKKRQKLMAAKKGRREDVMIKSREVIKIIFET